MAEMRHREACAGFLLGKWYLVLGLIMAIMAFLSTCSKEGLPCLFAERRSETPSGRVFCKYFLLVSSCKCPQAFCAGFQVFRSRATVQVVSESSSALRKPELATKEDEPESTGAAAHSPAASPSRCASGWLFIT